MRFSLAQKKCVPPFFNTEEELISAMKTQKYYYCMKMEIKPISHFSMLSLAWTTG